MPASKACFYCPKEIEMWEAAAAVLDVGYA